MATRTARSAPGRVAVAGPHWLEHVPLLRRAPDEELELLCQALREAGDVATQAAGPRRGQRRRPEPVMVAARAPVDDGGHEHGAGSERERRRTGGERGPLPEELDLDARAGQVTLAQQPDEPPRAQRPKQGAARRLVEGHDRDAHGPPLGDEPLEELRRLE